APECIEMIRRVGRKMQVRWDGTGVEQLTHEVGAHPLLARLAASDVVTRFPGRPLRPTVGQVQTILRHFHQTQNAIFEQMIQSLRRYYPDELDLLTIIASGDIQFAVDLVEQTPSLLNHLAGYGVIDGETFEISIPVMRRWLSLHRPASAT
ncbi:MAG: hypothetical protein LC808_15800, partial [Actinobacteria bacterium]|nr:hypothetical protein [Actinomycetota bacterium]